jgi:hypothetical protein
MFTKILLTLGSEVKSLKASITCLSEAPPQSVSRLRETKIPPTSKKLAGVPPCKEIMSMVAIARPAPFTKHPIFPSRPINRVRNNQSYAIPM